MTLLQSSARPSDAETWPDRTRHSRNRIARNYQGTGIGLTTILHHRPVIRIFGRHFGAAMRNWQIATTVPRLHPETKSLACQVEAQMLKKVGDTLTHFESRQKRYCELAQANGVDLALIRHADAFVEHVTVIGPVAMRLQLLFLTCDRFLDASAGLYAFGQIDGDVAYHDILEVKGRLQSTIATVRNQRKMVLELVTPRRPDSFTAPAQPG